MSPRLSLQKRALIRSCGTCRKQFTTTSDSPLVRKIKRDGKKNATTYYCCQACINESYSTADTETRSDYFKSYYRQNRDRKLAQMTAYYAANRDDIIAYRRRARAAG